MDEHELHERADRYMEAHRIGKAPGLHEVISDVGDDGERLADLIELRLALADRPLLDNEADLRAVAAVMREPIRAGESSADFSARVSPDNVTDLGRFRSTRRQTVAVARKARERVATTRDSALVAAMRRSAASHAPSGAGPGRVARLARKVRNAIERDRTP